jgi:hypothetical protein
MEPIKGGKGLKEATMGLLLTSAVGRMTKRGQASSSSKIGWRGGEGMVARMG